MSSYRSSTERCAASSNSGTAETKHHAVIYIHAQTHEEEGVTNPGAVVSLIRRACNSVFTALELCQEAVEITSEDHIIQVGMMRVPAYVESE